MFYSANYKCIFIHTPKTAGLSIEKAFEDLSSFTFVGGHFQLEAAKTYISRKLDELIDDYFIFCFVRNPWDRFVSAYNYLLNGGLEPENKNHIDSEDYEQFIAPYKTFTDFVLNNSDGEKLYEDILYQQHFHPQYKWFLNSQDKLDDINYIGRFENLTKDFNTICEILKISKLPLKHINKREHKPYQEYYTEETKKIIYNTYIHDINYFNYSFSDSRNKA